MVAPPPEDINSDPMGSQTSGTGVQALGVSKRFGPLQALSDVSLTITPGTIHAVIGENGAGKSTLGKILAGVLQPDSGQIIVDGEAVTLKSPRSALSLGIATIEQEVALAPNLTAEGNVFLGVEPSRLGMLRRGEVRRRWSTASDGVGLELSGGELVQGLSLAQQQQIEILRATSRRARLIIMDEPTAALGRTEAAALALRLKELAAGGAAIMIISHSMREVLALADTITVLRDGRHIRTGPAAEETESTLIRAMLGRSVSSVFPRRTPPPQTSPVVLEAREVEAVNVDGVSLELRAGEIVGIAGLEGSGRLELGMALYGALPMHGGSVVMGGHEMTHPTPRESQRWGTAIIPPSRRDDGLFFARSAVENATVGCVDKLSRFGVIRRGAERAQALEVLERLDFSEGRATSAVGTLSGGNQQKVLFARASLRRPVALLAMEPTRGVDIGAKASIYKLLADFAAAGVGILLSCSEQEEVIGLAHRILVMSRGRIAAELTGEDMTEENVLSAAFGNVNTSGVTV